MNNILLAGTNCIPDGMEQRKVLPTVIRKKNFDVFDSEYYALMKNDKQLYPLIGTYIKQHPQECLTKETE